MPLQRILPLRILCMSPPLETILLFFNPLSLSSLTQLASSARPSPPLPLWRVTALRLLLLLTHAKESGNLRKQGNIRKCTVEVWLTSPFHAIPLIKDNLHNNTGNAPPYRPGGCRVLASPACQRLHLRPHTQSHNMGPSSQSALQDHTLHDTR